MSILIDRPTLQRSGPIRMMAFDNSSLQVRVSAAGSQAVDGMGICPAIYFRSDA